MKSISITRLKLAEFRVSVTGLPNTLEMKSISITRLKRVGPGQRVSAYQLEMKSISITRLKPDDRDTREPNLRSWNEKYLDYEIETFA